MRKEVRAYTAMTRKQLADRAGVCAATLGKWIKKHKARLEKLGYSDRELLPPRVVEYLSEIYVIIE